MRRIRRDRKAFSRNFQVSSKIKLDNYYPLSPASVAAKSNFNRRRCRSFGKEGSPWVSDFARSKSERRSAPCTVRLAIKTNADESVPPVNRQSGNAINSTVRTGGNARTMVTEIRGCCGTVLRTSRDCCEPHLSWLWHEFFASSSSFSWNNR